MMGKFLVIGGPVTRLWLSEVARCTQRGFFEATAGECDELDTISYQHGMNGDCIDEDNYEKRLECSHCLGPSLSRQTPKDRGMPVVLYSARPFRGTAGECNEPEYNMA
ncbi:unnamed protein product [Penicillium camemberti]|uniref:Str. FM013 n=1 Tax=Penicillium camemberti (strain FM 013) TaxID=1429867 RepID=A0A0G4PLX3_PENC3|nr:unnamed protein product [Penicillium camemberti]